MYESYFHKAITGKLGYGKWKNALTELEEVSALADEKAVVDDDGAIMWKGNHHYLMDDLCEQLEYAGYKFNRAVTNAKRRSQDEKMLAEYTSRRNGRVYDDEELSEMRDAFGIGTVVVDVITGNTFTL